MIRDKIERKITRNDVYAKYFSLCDTNDGISEEFNKQINQANLTFQGRHKIRILIRGSVFETKENRSYFTFLDKEFNIDRESFEEALVTLDNFSTFLEGKIENDGLFFSEPEQRFVSRKVVADAEIYIDVE